MVPYNRILPWGLVLVLIIALLLQRAYYIAQDDYRIIADTTLTFDFTPHVMPSIVPKPGTETFQPIPDSIDSLAVVRAYYAVRRGSDSVSTENYTISFDWEVTQNKPTFFQPTIIDRKPTTIISHTTVKAPMNRYYGGISLGGTKEKFKFGLAAGVITKNEQVYVASYDFVNKEVLLTGLIPLNFRRP